MAEARRTTLLTQAWMFTAFGKAYYALAQGHRIAAAAQRKREHAVRSSDPFLEAAAMRHLPAKIGHSPHFDGWIYEIAMLVEGAEWLLAKEIELARSYGVTWNEIALTLGVSRQAAWERFGRDGWRRSRRSWQARTARRAVFLRDMAKTSGAWRDEDAAAQLREWLS